jgi:amidase
MAFDEYSDHDGIGLAALVAKKEITPVELMDEAIARAEALNSELNAVIYKDYERARETAKQNSGSGVFGGVPFLLKDILGFAHGMPTRQGSRFQSAHPWPHDSVTTVRFKAAGLIPFGKTNVPEFGIVAATESRLYGPAHNPWSLAHSPGGSSGGAAAAVAAGIVPLAHANDGGGSIRIPASCCGLVGLKATRGRNTYAPDLADAGDGLAVDLVVSRSVRDTAAALDTVIGNVQGDPYWGPPAPPSYLQAIERAPKKLRIAFTPHGRDGKTLLHPDCVAAINQAAKLCEQLGHHVEEAAPPLDERILVPAFLTFWRSGLASQIDGIAARTGQKPDESQFEALTWGLYQAGKQVSASEYLRAKFALQMGGRIMAKFHETYDVWLTGTLARPPARIGEFDMNETDYVKGFAAQFAYVPFTAMQNATGQPAINLPLHWNGEGLPIGVQFVGRFGDEETLLQLSRQLEQAQPWWKRYSEIGL